MIRVRPASGPFHAFIGRGTEARPTRGTLPLNECTDRSDGERVPSPDPFDARASLGAGLPDYYRLDVLGDRIDLGPRPSR